MSKFNQKTNIETKVKNMPGATANHEGGLSFDHGDKTNLMKMVATSLMGEDKFYVKGADHDSEMIDLVHKIAKTDPEFILKLALYTREVLHLRSVPMMLLVEYANSEHKPVSGSRGYVARTIQRADELTEIIAYQLTRNTYEPRKSKLPMTIRGGVAYAFNKFDEYQFGKYNRDGDVSLRDALFMTHPVPKDANQARLFDKIVEDTLETPDTWETYISANGSNTESWSHVSTYMPIFALIRNLRNLMQHDVPIEFYKHKLNNSTTIQNSKMLPFRFYSAYKALMVDRDSNPMMQRKVMEVLERAMELSIANMERIPGDTAIYVDVSASMDGKLNEFSTVSQMEIARLFGAIADRICDNAIIGVFGEDFATIPVSHSATTLSKMNEIKNTGVGHATNGFLGIKFLRETKTRVDRVIVFSDEQLYDSTPYNYWGRNNENESEKTIQVEMAKYRSEINQNAYLHSVDLAGYKNTMVPKDDPKSNLIAGWSDRILDYILSFEGGLGTMLDDVENYDLSRKRKRG